MTKFTYNADWDHVTFELPVPSGTTERVFAHHPGATIVDHDNGEPGFWVLLRRNGVDMTFVQNGKDEQLQVHLPYRQKEGDLDYTRGPEYRQHAAQWMWPDFIRPTREALALAAGRA